MRNITVSVGDDTYRRSRIRAAELDTSVSALVRTFLRNLAGDSGRESGRAARETDSSVELQCRYVGGGRMTITETSDKMAGEVTP